MKHLNVFFSLLVLNCVVVLAQPVNYSQTLADLISTKKWFEIENYYQQHKDSIDKEFVALWYLAETGYALNRRFEAIDAYEQLIDNNPLNMDALTLFSYLGQPLLQLYANIQEYSKGEELCQRLITLVKNDTIIDPDMRLSYIQGGEQAIENFRLFSQMYPKLTISKKEDNNVSKIELIQSESDNSISFNAKWNGNKLKTNFDTGASLCYIYNRAVAEKIGVKFNTNDTTTTNNGTIHGFVGVVDSLEIGEFSIKNIPVFVNIGMVDPADSIQIKCDSILNSAFDIVLGIPVIRQLGVIEFDFVKNTISFPQKTGTLDKRNLYIDNSSNLFMNTEICNVSFLTYFDTGGNDGLSINTDFYDKHKQCISTELQAKQIRSALGSCNEASVNYRNVYHCPQIDIKINGQEIKILNDCSVAKDKENDNEHGATEGGFMGNAIFKYCKKATFDFNNMIFSVEQ